MRATVPAAARLRTPTLDYALIGLLVGLGLVAPFVVYPIFLMKALCFALFACAFNLLLGYVGLLSFGHAAFFGWAAYVCGHTAKAWGWPPELAILAGTAAATLLGVGFGWLAIRLLGVPLSTFTLTVLVLAAALPSASTVSLLAERYGADNGRVTRAVVLSTALAFVTFTLLAWLVGARPR